MTDQSIRDYFQNRVVLVTGGAGAIGSNLVRRLADSRVGTVIVLDNLISGFRRNLPDLPNVLFVSGDIRSDNDLRQVFRMRPSVIFHLAAFFANQNSVDHPVECEHVNGEGLLKILEYATISGCCERFVFTNSEGGAYGESSSLPYSEDDVCLDVATPYYISKLAGEAYCWFYLRQHGLPVSVLRLFNSFGPGEAPGSYRNVIPNFIYWALKGLPLPLTGHPHMARDFVYVDDTVDAIVRAGVLASAVGTPINIASGRPTRTYELAEMINTRVENGAGTRIIPPRKWDNRPVIIGNGSRAQALLGFQPTVSVEEGLDRTVEWFRANWNWIQKNASFLPGKNPALPC